MSTYATIPGLTVPDASLSSPPSDASANWGKVYQNYISTNLSSENLAKGAYDAYNLLTTKNLSTFSIATVNAITSLRESVVNIDNALQENFDSLYESDRIISSSLKQILVGPLNNLSYSSTYAKYPLHIPKNDTGNEEFIYDLTEKITIPFVGKDGMGNYMPGLIKGRDYHKFSVVSDCFMDHKYHSTGPSSADWVEDYATLLANDAFLTPRDGSSRMEILAFKINSLQAQVAELKKILNNLLAGEADVVIKDLKVNHISFVSNANSQIDFSNFDERFMKQGIITTII